MFLVPEITVKASLCKSHYHNSILEKISASFFFPLPPYIYPLILAEGQCSDTHYDSYLMWDMNSYFSLSFVLYLSLPETQAFISFSTYSLLPWSPCVTAMCFTSRPSSASSAQLLDYRGQAYNVRQHSIFLLHSEQTTSTNQTKIKKPENHICSIKHSRCNAYWPCCNCSVRVLMPLWSWHASRQKFLCLAHLPFAKQLHFEVNIGHSILMQVQ